MWVAPLLCLLISGSAVQAFSEPELENFTEPEIAENQVSKKYTKSPTGCACWFDLGGELLEPNSCACCKTGGRQCGYPRHNLCHKIDKQDSRTGCKGINEWRYTLSEIGHPCSFDPTRKDCAWCTHGKNIRVALTLK